MSQTIRTITLQEFLAMPESNERSELVDGELKPKVSPKFKHSRIQGRLYRLLDDWCEQQQIGRVLPEWAVVLQRRGMDWVPVPDLTFVSYERLPQQWEEDEPCLVAPELVIEIISPGQRFGELNEKAADYLLAGVERVWVVDPKTQRLGVFHQDDLPQTVTADGTIRDPLLPRLELPVSRLFT